MSDAPPSFVFRMFANLCLAACLAFLAFGFCGPILLGIYLSPIMGYYIGLFAVVVVGVIWGRSIVLRRRGQINRIG